MKKRFISAILALTMVVSMLPITVGAVDTATDYITKVTATAKDSVVTLKITTGAKHAGGTTTAAEIKAWVCSKKQYETPVDNGVEGIIGSDPMNVTYTTQFLNPDSPEVDSGGGSWVPNTTNAVGAKGIINVKKETENDLVLEALKPGYSYYAVIWSTNGPALQTVFPFSIGADGTVPLPAATQPGAPVITATDSDGGALTSVTLPKTTKLTASPNAGDSESAAHTYTYAWTKDGDAGFTASTASIEINTVAGTGTYSVTATRTKTDGSTSASVASTATTQAVTIAKGTYGQPTLAISAGTYAYGSLLADIPTLTAKANGTENVTKWTYAVATGTSATVNATTGAISLGTGTSAQKIGDTTFTVKATGNADYAESPVSAAVTLTVNKGTPAATTPAIVGVAPGTAVQNHAVDYTAANSPFATADGTKIDGKMTLTSTDKGAVAGGAAVTGVSYSFAPTDSVLYSTVAGTDATITAAAAKELQVSFTKPSDIVYGAVTPTIAAPTVTADGSALEASGNWKLQYSFGGGTYYNTLDDAAHKSTAGKLKVGTYTVKVVSTNALYSDAVTPVTTSFAVTQKEMTLDKHDLDAGSKYYDGIAAPSSVGGNALLGTFEKNDIVVLDSSSGGGVSYKFLDANVSTSKPVVGTGFILTGADAGNYSIKLDENGSQVPGLIGKISKAQLKLASNIVLTKKYDGNTDLTQANKDTIAGATITGIALSQNIKIDATNIKYVDATRDTSAVELVAPTAITFTGTGASNYEIFPHNAYKITGQITPAAQTLTVDSTATVYVGGGAVELVLTSDASGDVGYTPAVKTGTGTGSTGTYASAAYGTNKITITPISAGTETITVSSPATTNYAAAANKTITVTVSAGTTNDMTATADKTAAQYGDTFIVTGVKGTGNTAALVFPDNGTNCKKTETNANGLSATYEVTASTGNASVTVTQAAADGVAQGSASITAVVLSQRIITLTGTLTAKDKVYDGTTAATINELPSTLTVANKLAADTDIALAGAFTGSVFASKDASTTARAITLGTGSVTIGGTNATHYTLTGTTFPTVDAKTISARPITVSLNPGIAKVYGVVKTLENADFTAQANATNAGLATSESIADLGITAYTCAGQAANANVGEYPVTALTATTTNYTVSIAGTNKLTVTEADQVALVLTGVAATATYGDGTMTLGTTGGSGTGAVTYALTANANGAAELTDGNTKILIKKPGSFTVQATKALDGNYKEVKSTAITCAVGKKALTITPTTLTLVLADSGKVDLRTKVTAADTLTGLTAPVFDFTVKTQGSAVASITNDKDLAFTTVSTDTVLEAALNTASQVYYSLANGDIALHVSNLPPLVVENTKKQEVTYSGVAQSYAITSVKAGTDTLVKDDTNGYEVKYYSTTGTAVNAADVKNVGVYNVVISPKGNAATTHIGVGATTSSDYQITIKKAKLTLTTTVSKTYDGDTGFTFASDTFGTKVLTGVNGETATLTGFTGTPVYANKNVATPGAITSVTAVTATIVGTADLANYDLNDVTGIVLNGSITPIALTWKTPVAVAAFDKTYDGSTALTLATAKNDLVANTYLTGVIAADASSEKITIAAKTYDTAYASKNAADGVTVTFPKADMTLTTGNYTLPASGSGFKANIAKQALTVAKKAPISMAPGGLKVSDLVTVTGIQTGDTIDSLFGTTFTNNTANAKGVTVHVQTTATPPVTATLPLTAGSYTFGFAVTKATFETANTNYTITDPAITGGTITVTTPPPAGGGYVTETYMVTFDAGKFGKLDGNSIVSVEKGKFVKSTPKVIANANYNFKGWSLDGKTVVDPLTVAITKGTSFTAIYTTYPVLDKENHMQYIKGYDDGTFKPSNRITRAEAATMFARVMKDKIDMNATYATAFTDVPADAWYAKYVGFMEKYGVIKGYADGTFKPNAPITRAEFATMVSRFGELTKMDKNIFSDVADNFWAKNEILSAAANNWVGGYEDGTFKPDSDITRAEAVKIINSMLGRVINAQSIEGATYTTFTDMTVEHWAYYHVIEAANGHEYNKVDGNGVWKK